MDLQPALTTLKKDAPKCIAAGVVDTTTGAMMSVLCDEDLPQDILDTLGSSTQDLLASTGITAFQRAFERGYRNYYQHEYCREIVMVSADRLLVFQRCPRLEQLVVVIICHKDADLDVVRTKAREAAETIDTLV